MAFKIKDGVRIGTVDVFNNAAESLNVKVKDTNTGSGVVALKTESLGSGTFTQNLQAKSGTIALTSDLTTAIGDVSGSIGDGTLSVTVAEDGTTGNSVYITTGSGFSANASTNSTYDIHVGPALKNLADTMTTAGTGFIKKTAADTYALDTNTYLTAESDTLQTVTTRGATSNVATVSLTGGTASSSTATGTLVVTGGVGVSGALNVGGAASVGGNLTVTGDLTVNGTTTTVNSTTISVDDKNIELGAVASPSNTTADGGGITLKGTTDKTFNWVNSTGAWTSSEHLAVAAGKNIQISGATSGTATIVAPAVASTPTLTLPTTTGTVALTSDIKSGTLGVSIGTAAATGTALAWGTSSGFNANASTNSTYDLKVGPSLTSLATLMTGATTGFIKKTAADTYTLDTNTYLTSQSNDFGTVKIATDTGFTWGTANVNNDQIADAVGDTLTIVNGTGIDLYADTTAGADAIKIAHADTSTLTGTQGTNGIASITVDGMGHVTGVTTATYLTAQNTSKNIVGASGTATANATATNGNVYLNHLENTTVTSAHKIVGAGGTTVTSDASGNITITSNEADTLASITGRGNTTTTNIQLNSGASLVLAGATDAKIWTNAVVPANVTVNTAVALDTWASTTYRSAKYTIQLVQGTKYQQHEVRLIHDGTSVYMTEYAVLESNAASPIPVTFVASIAAGTLSFNATITDAATTNVSVIMERTLFAV